MSDTENIPAQASNVEGQVMALQRQVFLLLLALVVITATLVFYLFSESIFLSKDLTEMRPQAINVIRAYSNNRQAITTFRQKLGNYALEHPSFQPVLKKYGWTGASTTAPKGYPSLTPALK